MPAISREKLKVRGLKRLMHSVKYSVEGLMYAYKNEQSMLLHFMACVAVLLCGLIFSITGTEWLILILALTVIMVVELFNTAIEAVVDMVTLELNPLAKIAKDCGSAAAFVVSIITFVISISIFLPYFIGWFE